MNKGLIRTALTALLVLYVVCVCVRCGGEQTPTESEEEVASLAPPESQFGIEMVFVKGGTFLMGCTPEQGIDCNNNERPAHQVTLSDYYIGKYEVTQEQWKAVMGSDNNPSYFRGDNLPVEQVNWDGTQKFINKLNERTGGKYRLPTEAEWEYAARGGSESGGYKFSGSNDVGDAAWYNSNSSQQTHPVGAKECNELGIYDMSGNVWEFTSDWYGRYSGNAQTNPRGVSSGSYRVYRGGGWYNRPGGIRVSARRNIAQDAKGISSIGFRLAHSSR